MGTEIKQTFLQWSGISSHIQHKGQKAIFQILADALDKLRRPFGQLIAFTDDRDGLWIAFVKPVVISVRTVAALNFDRHDHIWHIYTPEEAQKQAHEGAIMHVSHDSGVKLIKGPFIALGAYIYNPGQSFRSTQDEQRSQIEAQERARCAEVMRDTTPAQLTVLQAFARGLRPQQVADELLISLVTVNTHKAALFELCRIAWNIPKKERLYYHFLHAKFASQFPDDE